MSKLGTILREHGITAADVKKVVAAYAEPHRYWHTEQHVLSMLDYMSTHLDWPVNARDRDHLVLAACYHDVVYDPERTDNEERSAALFEDHTDGFFAPDSVHNVTRLIKETAPGATPTCPLSRLLREADINALCVGLDRIGDMLDYGRRIYLEYQAYDYSVFLPEHLRIVQGMLAAADVGSATTLAAYEGVMRARRLRVGIYAGSYNPWHKGHADVLAQATQVFDKVVIARGVNPAKSNQVASNLVLNPVKIDGAPSHLEAKEFVGPLWKLYQHYAAQANYDVAIIRGIRGAADLESEITQRSFVRDAAEAEVPYVFIAAKPELAHISSSAIKAMAALGADVSRYLP